MRISLRVAATTVLVATFCFCGCRKRAEPTQRKPERRDNIVVVATVYPLADVAQQIGQPRVNVSWVVESGQSLTGVQPDDQLHSRLRLADLMISGGATEPWASAGTTDEFNSQRVVRLDLLPSTRGSPTIGLLWLDPILVRECAQELRSKLTIAWPRHEQTFREQADRFVAALDAVVDEFKPKLAAAPTRRVLVLSSDYHAMLARFGFEPVLTLQIPPTQLGGPELARLKFLAQQNDARALLVPADTPAAVVRDLEARSGLRVVPIDSLGTSATGGRNTYLKMLRYNLEQLEKAAAR